MFYEHRDLLCTNYNRAKAFFCANPDMLIDVEHYVSSIVNDTIADNFEELACDYNEASYLNAFWAEYPLTTEEGHLLVIRSRGSKLANTQ